MLSNCYNFHPLQETIPVTQLVRETAAVMQEFTQSGYDKLIHVFTFIAVLKLLIYEQAMSNFCIEISRYCGCIT